MCANTCWIAVLGICNQYDDNIVILDTLKCRRLLSFAWGISKIPKCYPFINLSELLSACGVIWSSILQHLTRTNCFSIYSFAVQVITQVIGQTFWCFVNCQPEKLFKKQSSYRWFGVLRCLCHCRDSLLTAVLNSWAPLWSVHILYSNISHILLLYKTWGYYNKFDSMKPLLTLLMSQYTTMRVYGAWIKTYYVLCPNTYSNFGYVSWTAAIPR